VLAQHTTEKIAHPNSLEIRFLVMIGRCEGGTPSKLVAVCTAREL
jgi:hypothetical protein